MNREMISKMGEIQGAISMVKYAERGGDLVAALQWENRAKELETELDKMKSEKRNLEWVECEEGWWQADEYDAGFTREWILSCIQSEDDDNEWTMRVVFIDDEKDRDDDENYQTVVAKKFKHRFQSVALRRAKRHAESWARKLELI